MHNPRKGLLVTATTAGDNKQQVTGYYHYDPDTHTHYVREERTLKRYWIDPHTVRFKHESKPLLT